MGGDHRLENGGSADVKLRGIDVAIFEGNLCSNSSCNLEYRTSKAAVKQQ